MTREDYIEGRRKRAVEIASDMIDGAMDYLEGSIELSSLRFEVGLPEDDEDFRAFTGVMSETDHLPIGNSREYWSEASLKMHDAEIQRSTEWAREVSLSNCKSIVERFNA